MNQNEWVAQFEATYHRKPTAQEFQAAKTSGQFVLKKFLKQQQYFKLRTSAVTL